MSARKYSSVREEVSWKSCVSLGNNTWLTFSSSSTTTGLCCFTQTMLRIQIGAARAKGQLLFHPTVKTHKVTTWYLTKWSWKTMRPIYWWSSYLCPEIKHVAFPVYSPHPCSIKRWIIVCCQYWLTVICKCHIHSITKQEFIFPSISVWCDFFKVPLFFSWDNGRTLGPECVIYFGGQDQRTVQPGVMQLGGQRTEKWCNLEDDGE